MAVTSIKGDGNGYLEDLTIVLVGCTGSGKSATGNSILGRKAFQSMSCFGRVTTVCKRQSMVLDDGRILHVIDTPGLFDSSSKPEMVEKEIVRCIEMARDGIHAILLVVSLNVRFSDEQVATVETLKHLFGDKIVDYMIVTFTGGDQLEEDETLDTYLARSCPSSLKDLLQQCGNRQVVFNNRTSDGEKKAEQRRQLLTLITNTVVKNGGKPYTNELFLQLKNETEEKESRNSLKQKRNQAFEEEQLQQRIATMVREKLKERDEEIINKMQLDLERLQKEVNDQTKEKQLSQIEIQALRWKLAKAEEEIEKRWRCVVL